MTENQLVQQEGAQLAPVDPKEALMDMQGVWQNEEAFNTMVRGAVALSKSTLVPTAYQNRPDNCLIAIDMAGRMGLTPLVVMQQLYVVNGKPSWSGQACKMLIESCGRFAGVETVYTGEKDKDTWGCRLTAIRKSTGETIIGPEVTIEMAKKEGWYSKRSRDGNETSKWQTMPELMLAYRAAAFFARVHCPEALMGMGVVEEQQDVAGRREVEDALK